MSRKSTVAQSKQAEREVAALMGGQRLHAGEWHGPGDVDVIDKDSPAVWVAQVKHRAAVPGYILKGLRQIQEAALSERPPYIPLLVIKTKPGRGKDSRTFVVMEAEDWFEAYGRYPTR